MSRLLRDRGLVDKLRATESADALYALLVDRRSRPKARLDASSSVKLALDALCIFVTARFRCT